MFFWKIIVHEDRFSIYNPTVDETCAEFPFKRKGIDKVPTKEQAEKLATDVCQLLNNQDEVVSYEEHQILQERYNEVYRVLNLLCK